MKKRMLLTGALALSLLGCQTAAPPSAQRAAGDNAAATGAVSRIPAVTGTLQIPGQNVQALPSDILTSATVTLIDPATSQAVSSGLTDSSGNFTLKFSENFNPVIGSTWIIEASKGLSNHSPGYYSPRFRTLIQLTVGGWTSITGNAIFVNALTTAIAIEHALDKSNVTADSTIGKVTAPATLVVGAFAPLHPDAEVYQLASDISNYLTNNLDPVLSVSSIVPQIGSFTPTTGGAGTIVTIYGKGFNAVPNSTTVTFNGVPASIIYVAPRTDTPGQTRMAVVTPAAFTSGKIQVNTPIGSVQSAGNFITEIPTLTGFSVATGSVDTTVTLNGTNFDLNRNNDIVRFNGVLAPVTAATTTTLTCKVPAGASTGNVVVNTNAGASNARAFTVHPGITSLSRTSGPQDGTVVISGYNFDGVTPNNNQVRFNGTPAVVTAATANSITCTVPPGATSGLLTVTVGTEASVGTPFYVVPKLTGNGTL